MTNSLWHRIKQYCCRATVAALAVPMLTSCWRDLYVSGEEFYSVSINVDWRQYVSPDPDGMTVFFYTNDGEQPFYMFSTSEVRHYEFYLGQGHYTGIVFDYSPDEFSNQEFFDIENPELARVVARPASYQPDSIAELYGPQCFHQPIGTPDPKTGLYTVVDQIEQMALDTLRDRSIFAGEYGDYIPYEEEETYQSTLIMQQLMAVPRSLRWQMRIRLLVKGFDNLWQTEGTIAGLADGHLLARDRNTGQPCLIAITDWETTRTGDNIGYIAATISTFGLRDGLRPRVAYDADGALVWNDPYVHPDGTRADGTRSDGIGDRTNWDTAMPLVPEDLRLNLRFVLRDQLTELTYHYDIGHVVTGYADQQVLRADMLQEGWSGVEGDVPNLPDVEALNGTGFDATVTPWEDVEKTDVVM